MSIHSFGENVVEGTDAAADSGTAYSMSVGDMFSGTLTAGDRDWVSVELVAGETYTITLDGSGGGGGTLSDSYLRIHAANGALLALDDDGGAGRDSEITFVATATRTHYVSAGSYDDSYSGTYQMAVETMAPIDRGRDGTLQEMADFLTDGFWNGNGYRFDTSSDNTLTVDLTGLTFDGARLARWALEAWEAVADIEFQEVTNGTADIEFDDNQSGAFAGANSIQNGYTSSSFVNVSTAWLAGSGTTIDSYSFQTYVHEIGHALGLGHQGDYNGSASYGSDNTFANDSWQMSVMSYFSQTENTTTTASLGYTMTAMMVDVVAIQDLYGASTVTAGNTNWGSGTFGTYLDDVFDSLAGGSGGGNIQGGRGLAFTIYDHSGVDTVDISYLSEAARLDLRGGNFSDIAGGLGNLGIAEGTVIENATLGNGNDVVTGNSLGNVINGGGGNDQIWALSGNDIVSGGAGDDTIGGANGNDVLSGDAGDDVLWGANGNDTLTGNADNDLLGGGAGNDTLYGGAGNDSLYGGTELDVIYGGDGDDTIDGWAHIDQIDAGAGDDLVIGGNWGDTIYGGDGDDLLFGDGDTRIANNYTGSDLVSGGGGNDIIVGGTGADTLNGDNGNDVLWGGDGWNQLNGGNGNDRMIGGNHTDRISGGNGSDIMTGGGARDVFIFNAGTNTDRILDFSVSDGDRLTFDEGLWASSGRLTQSQVVNQFASVTADGDTMFDFGGEDRVILVGVDDLTGLSQLVDII